MVHEATDVGRRVEKYRGLGNMRNAVVVIGGATREGGREATPRDRRGASRSPSQLEVLQHQIHESTTTMTT